MSGVVHAVGKDVYEYKPGDRVAAFHKMGALNGAYAEYSIAPATTTFHLPPKISFEEGATIPLSGMTAALALFTHLKLPTPWCPTPPGKSIPLVIYGGATTVGAFGLKFAKLSNIHPLITVAGNGIDFVESLGAADHIVDYRKGNVVGDIKSALAGKALHYAVDFVCNRSSPHDLTAVLDTNGGAKLNMLDPPEGFNPQGVELTRTYVSTAYGEAHSRRSAELAAQDRDFAYVFYRYISLLMGEGRLRGHPFEVMPGGLDSVVKGITMLYENKVSAKKLVYRIEDTFAIKK